MNRVEEIKKLIESDGYTVEPGIGSEFEFFASKAGLSIAIVVYGDEISFSSSNEEKEIYTISADEKDRRILLGAAEALADEEEFIQNGGEPLHTPPCEEPEDPEDYHDDSDRGCQDCPPDECTGHCMSCYYRSV